MSNALLALTLPLLACGSSGGSTPGADSGSDGTAASYTLVIAHANIVGSANASADAVAVAGATIAAIGSSADLMASCTGPCQLIDAQGGYLLPGFHDSHAHLERAADLDSGVQVSGSDPATIQQAVHTYALANSPSTRPWIIGFGWSIAGFTTLPSAATLDAAASRPVVLTDTSLHNVWVNTAAMTAAGIDANGTHTPDPSGGHIVRDATGKATGVFLDAASALVTRVEPAETDAQIQDYILTSQAESVHAGYTAMEGGPISLDVAKAYAELDAAGKLSQRVFLWAPLDAAASADTLQPWLDFASSLPPGSRVHLAAFKGLVDGIFGSRTAALLAPYADDPSTSGQVSYSPAALAARVIAANRAGYPVALHAIGDAAVKASLDAYEAAKTQLGTTPRNRVEHVSAIQAADIPRFAQLGVAASVQPTFMYYGSLSTAVFAQRLGTARLSEAFPWHSLQAAGTLLVFGTDYPVGALGEDPITGMYCAVKRTFIDGTPFTPSEAIDAQSALDAYTLNPAKLQGLDSSLGKIEVGYLADLDLFALDPREAAARSLATNPPLAVVIAGVPQPR
jgi:predicted amidohydrolase YtcJ